METKYKAGGYVIVAIGENIRLHLDRIADDSFDGIAARVNLRLDAFDDDAFPSIRGFLHSSDRLSGKPGNALSARPLAGGVAESRARIQLRNYTDNGHGIFGPLPSVTAGHVKVM